MFSFGIIAENFRVFENDTFYCKVSWMVGVEYLIYHDYA